MADAMQPPVRGSRGPKDADIALDFSPHRPLMGFCKRQRLGTGRIMAANGGFGNGGEQYL